MISGDPATTFGWAWVAAAVALGLHVADEATHDFLSWYNPRALRIRQALGGLPFPPTFTVRQWLLAMLAGILLRGVLAPAAYAGWPWMRPPAYAPAAIYLGNGLLHVVASLVARRPMPGVLSAPLLLLTGGWLSYAAAALG